MPSVTEPRKDEPEALVPLIIGAALLMQAFDAQAMTTILPAAAESLRVSPLELNLAIASYYVGAAAFLPVSGWLADRYGARSVFQASIAAFVLCSVLCAFAQAPWQFAVVRTAMGAATAGIMPIGRLLLLRTTPRADLVRRLTFLTIPGTVGPLISPVVAGALATYASWRWAFWLNVPIGLVGFLLVSRFVPNLKEDAPGRLDRRGAILAAFGLAAGVFVLERVGREGRVGMLEAVLGAFALLSVLAYALHARFTPKPILDFTLVRIVTFRAGVLGGFFFRLSIGCQPFLMALLFQVGLGMSAFISGALIALTAIGTLLMRWFAPLFVRALGFRKLLIANGIGCALLGLVPALFQFGSPAWLIAIVLLAIGFFRALQLTALNVVTYVDVDASAMSAASSLAATIQQVTQGLSIAFAASIVAAAIGRGENMTAAISLAFAVVGLIGLGSLFDFARVPPGAGADVSGERAKPASEG
ncbi:MAG: MFS transporter [Hyphomonadaceae bacterium]|nr:MFS transporter [Hyphomonadaceae bacterium]